MDSDGVQDATQPASARVIRCPACDAQVSAASAVCPECDTALDQGLHVHSSTRGRWTWCLAILAVLAITVVCVVLVRGTIVSSSSRNWAGFEATGHTFKSVTATWVQPEVAYGPPGVRMSTWFWVGLGNSRRSHVVQIDTAGYSDRGEVGYDAWYEAYPQRAVPIGNLSITPGDLVTATVTTNGRRVFKLTFVEFTGCTINGRPLSPGDCTRTDMVSGSGTTTAHSSSLGSGNTRFTVWYGDGRPTAMARRPLDWTVAKSFRVTE